LRHGVSFAVPSKRDDKLCRAGSRDLPKITGLADGLAIESGSALIPDLRLGSEIIPGQPTEGIKIKPRDFR
jgi:hypothetical protein